MKQLSYWHYIRSSKTNRDDMKAANISLCQPVWLWMQGQFINAVDIIFVQKILDDFLLLWSSVIYLYNNVYFIIKTWYWLWILLLLCKILQRCSGMSNSRLKNKQTKKKDRPTDPPDFCNEKANFFLGLNNLWRLDILRSG